MFKKFRHSPYAKAGFLILLCGGLLIIFNYMINKNRISIGFDNINKTLAPIYIGAVLAFVLCPIYNACVKWCYQRFVESAKKRGFSVGAMLIRKEGDLDVDRQEKRRLLGAARAVATLVCVLVVVGLAGLFLYFVVPQVVEYSSQSLSIHCNGYR